MQLSTIPPQRRVRRVTTTLRSVLGITALLFTTLMWISFPCNTLSCTTLAAGSGSTADGSVLIAHSNDGDGDTAGSLIRVPAANWPAGANRSVSGGGGGGGGSIPQVAHTFAYFTKPGGYASLNEYGVALGESTCNAAITGNKSAGAILNIVDLSELGLERASTARAAIDIMGSLAVAHGYYDAGESLMVGDAKEAWIFHILPDFTGKSAIWAAQRIPDNHVAVVANAFTIREINLDEDKKEMETKVLKPQQQQQQQQQQRRLQSQQELSQVEQFEKEQEKQQRQFLFSANIREMAARTGRWRTGSSTLDFVKVFSAPEFSHYCCGRRMWYAFKCLAPAVHFPATYKSLVHDKPYPATVSARGVDVRSFFSVMRSWYQNTSYDLGAAGLAAGPFGAPFRAAAGAGEASLPSGRWERPIGTHKTIVGYVIHCRSWLPRKIASVLWFAPHASYTSVYVPWPAGYDGPVPAAYSNCSLSVVKRGTCAWQAARWVYNIAQIHFSMMIQDVRAAQKLHEDASFALMERIERAYVAGNASDFGPVAQAVEQNAVANVRAWWELSDILVTRYADGYCNGCGRGPRHLGYPAWWLRAVNYTGTEDSQE